MSVIIMQYQIGVGGIPPIEAGPADCNARRQRVAFQPHICMHTTCPVIICGYAISAPGSPVPYQLPVIATKRIFRNVFAMFQTFIAYICSAAIPTHLKMLFYREWLCLAQISGT